MIDRLLPTLFLVGAGFILCLLCVAVYVAVAAVDNRRAARDAEAAARPTDAHTATATADAAATLTDRLNQEQHPMTYTRTHVHIAFANPYLVCELCRQPVTGWHSNDKCGCEAPCWNVPCEHALGTIDTCPAWSPVDGCQCQEHLGHVPHPPAPAESAS